MNYQSTRSSAAPVTPAQAIVAGLAPDGGLYLPEQFPQVGPEQLRALVGMDYEGRAVESLSLFLTDFSRQELAAAVAAAYSRQKFAPPQVAPVVSLDDRTHVLELFHGPTCAFKDFALQLLPHLLTGALAKTGCQKTAVILVATSGDTGKAALEGFADVPGTKICVFYPDGGTSNMQRLQMTTQKGGNVQVLAVDGNFDNAQTGVKKIFTDRPLEEELDGKGFLLSSANSINWGRLAPQIVYYFSAYCQLVQDGKIALGQQVNICVPTGNFGNILAAYYAKHCGLPVAKFICASNQNNILTDFLTTGIYDRNRPFYLTTSPSMDILISSNLERLLYLLCGRDPAKLKGYMDQLSAQGRYQVDGGILERLQAEFAAGWADDAAAARTIRRVWEQYGYLCDTHTAVAMDVLAQYQQRTGDATPTLVSSTASPFKFADAVLPAAFGVPAQGDDFARLAQLAAASGLAAPAQLLELQSLPERFTRVVPPDRMKQAVQDWLLGNG